MRGGEITHVSLMDGQARALIVDATNAANIAMKIHGASRTCAAALGRGLVAATMLGSTNKTGRITLTFNGDGPCSPLCVVTEGEVLKVTINEPALELPRKPSGKLDVGGAIGKHGRLSVVRDMGLKEPYVGQTSLVSGEIAEDLCLYLTVSEQTPSMVGIGALVGETVEACGGVLVQPLPGCAEDVLARLENLAEAVSNVSSLIQREPNEALARTLFNGMKPVTLETRSLSYQCDCSNERMERALVSLGRDELRDILSTQGEARLVCSFCGNEYTFDDARLRILMKEQE